MIHDKFDLQGVIDRLEKTKHDLPLVLANQAETFFQASFKNEGFTDSSFSRWRPRQARANMVRAKDITRRILTKTGRLRRSIHTYEANFDRIVIGSDVPYAKMHNEGFRGTEYVKPHRRFVDQGDTMGTGIYSTKTRRERRAKILIKQDVKGYTRKMNMPKRQFIGDSVTLQKMQVKTITKVLDTIWR